MGTRPPLHRHPPGGEDGSPHLALPRGEAGAGGAASSPQKEPPRTHRGPAPHRPQPAAGPTGGHDQNATRGFPHPGGARCGSRPPAHPQPPPAPDAPCPAVTPTGNGDFNAAAASPQPRSAPPVTATLRLTVPPTFCRPPQPRASVHFSVPRRYSFRYQSIPPKPDPVLQQHPARWGARQVPKLSES